MNDLISRQAAIDAIKELCEHYTPTKSVTYHPHMDFVIEELKALPSAQPELRWIPCSVRPPEAQTEVIVSCTDDSGDTKFRYTSSGWVTTNKEYWIIDNEINNFVVA